MPRIFRSHTTIRFENSFENLPKEIQKIAAKKIILFENNFLHPGLNIHKLKGSFAHFWAFYITMKYRVIFRFLDRNEVIYYDIDTHDIYK